MPVRPTCQQLYPTVREDPNVRKSQALLESATGSLLTFCNFSSINSGATAGSACTTTVLASTSVTISVTPDDKSWANQFLHFLEKKEKILNLPSILPRILLTAEAQPLLWSRRQIMWLRCARVQDTSKHLDSTYHVIPTLNLVSTIFLVQSDAFWNNNVQQRFFLWRQRHRLSFRFYSPSSFPNRTKTLRVQE